VLEILIHSSDKKSAFILLLLFLPVIFISALEISAPIYLVADASNGRIILEKGEGISIPPASLAKLMTLNLSLDDVGSGKLSYSELYEIPRGGDALSMRPGSSLLGLQAGDFSTLITLQRAAALVSANDAACTLALLSEENIQNFVDRMNGCASELGMKRTLYTDPDGWSSLSETTGEDQMRLILYYLNHHPGVLSRLHALPWMVYQDRDELTSTPEKRNTNLLIGRVEGVDGLKTGTIPSAGFHFAATAEREGTRFVVLVMGIRTDSYAESLNRRAEEAQLLLEWAFRNYISWKPDAPRGLVIRVRHGAVSTVGLEVSSKDLEKILPETLKISDRNNLLVLVDTPLRVTAPLRRGDVVGKISWYNGAELLVELPLRIDSDVSGHWRLKDIF